MFNPLKFENPNQTFTVNNRRNFVDSTLFLRFDPIGV